MSLETQRRHMKAIHKLCMYAKNSYGDWSVDADGDSIDSCIVRLVGPEESLYIGGAWRVRLTLPDNYPESPPRVNFLNRILHPNIHGVSGSVCLSSLNKTDWNSETELGWIFEIGLPWLLDNPNFDDPMNPDASELYRNDPQAYEEEVERYAMESAQEEEEEQAAMVQQEAAAAGFIEEEREQEEMEHDMEQQVEDGGLEVAANEQEQGVEQEEAANEQEQAGFMDMDHEQEEDMDPASQRRRIRRRLY